MTLNFLAYTLLAAWCTSYYASIRGRNELLWFIIGALFGIFGLALVLFIPSATSPPSTQKQKKEKEYQNPKDKTTEITIQQPQMSALPTLGWYYLDTRHLQQGPVSLDYMHTLWNQNSLTSKTFVWNETLTNWNRIENYHLFHEHLSGHNPNNK